MADNFDPMEGVYSDKAKRYYQETDVGFDACADCPHPDKCAKAGYCMMEKAQKGFMGDKYEQRKKGM